MFRRLPPAGGDQRAVAEIVNGMMDGKTNNTGSITLRQSQTTTTITDARISRDSVILFMPLNNRAAQEISTIYISARTNGSATITHGSHNFDMTFGYAVVG
jgi:hypothetical protein